MANYTIQFPGGSAAEIAGKTLAVREFCYDETNSRIYVGDGINEIPNLQYIASGGVTVHGALTGLGDDDHSAVYVRFTIGASGPAVPRAGDFWMVTP